MKLLALKDLKGSSRMLQTYSFGDSVRLFRVASLHLRSSDLHLFIGGADSPVSMEIPIFVLDLDGRLRDL